MYHSINNFSNTCANDCVAKGGGLKATHDHLFTTYHLHMCTSTVHLTVRFAVHLTMHFTAHLTVHFVHLNVHPVHLTVHLTVHPVHLTVHHVHLHISLCTMCTFTVHPCALHCALCAPSHLTVHHVHLHCAPCAPSHLTAHHVHLQCVWPWVLAKLPSRNIICILRSIPTVTAIFFLIGVPNALRIPVSVNATNHLSDTFWKGQPLRLCKSAMCVRYPFNVFSLQVWDWNAKNAVRARSFAGNTCVKNHRILQISQTL